MNSPSRNFSSRLSGLDPVAAGTACCVVSALGYSGSNVCMRYLADSDSLGHAMWAVFNKELVAVAVVGPWLLFRWIRGLPNFPSGRGLMLLIAISLAVQMVANVSMQWAFGKIGLAITVPAAFGIMLTASAIMGFVFLGERVSLRSAGAIGMLLFSLVLLGPAAGEAGKSIAMSDRFGIFMGVAAACLAGAVYAVFTIVIRHVSSGPTPTSSIVFVTTFIGVLSLGPLSLGRLGMEELLRTTPQQFGWMYAAGALNLIAFLGITKGLELTTVVHANVLNGSQVAMAAIAGMMLFDEPLTGWLIAGACLTVLGLVIIDRPTNGDRTADQHA